MATMSQVEESEASCNRCFKMMRVNRAHAIEEDKLEGCYKIIETKKLLEKALPKEAFRKSFNKISF
jgi:hypothetical protein